MATMEMEMEMDGGTRKDERDLRAWLDEWIMDSWCILGRSRCLIRADCL